MKVGLQAVWWDSTMHKTQRPAFCSSYTGSRNDIADLIPNTVHRVLDIGCSTGELGRNLKRKINKLEVVGIELNEQMAMLARSKLDRVIVGDIEIINLEDHFRPNYFDCVIFADILEHLKDPWMILKKSVEYLSNEGIVVASIPNVRHYSVIFDLLFRGYWSYRERGIQDKTHLRFFTLKNMEELLQNAGLDIIKLERSYRVIERPHPFSQFSKYFVLPLLKDFLTFQFRIVAKKFK